MNLTRLHVVDIWYGEPIIVLHFNIKAAQGQVLHLNIFQREARMPGIIIGKHETCNFFIQYGKQGHQHTPIALLTKVVHNRRSC